VWGWINQDEDECMTNDVMEKSYKGRKHKGDGEKLQNARQLKLILEHKKMHKTCKVQGDR
jgi:hypothetical protein